MKSARKIILADTVTLLDACQDFFDLSSECFLKFFNSHRCLWALVTVIHAGID